MELVRAIREKRLLGLAVVDIDHLQDINDKFGHPVGDECLKVTANVLKESIREYDAVGRIGADEFLIVFSTHSVAQFTTILERLHHNLTSNSVPIDQDASFPLRVSMGSVWITSVNPDIQIDDLLSQVEKQLMKSKSLGGNKITSGEIGQIV